MVFNQFKRLFCVFLGFGVTTVLYYVSSGSRGLYITLKEQCRNDYCIVMRNGVRRDCNSSIPFVYKTVI